MSNRFGVHDWDEPPHPSLCVGNTVLAELEFLAILRVTYDPHLTFEKYLSNVSANAARKLDIVRKTSYIYNYEGINATLAGPVKHSRLKKKIHFIPKYLLRLT